MMAWPPVMGEVEGMRLFLARYHEALIAAAGALEASAHRLRDQHDDGVGAGYAMAAATEIRDLLGMRGAS